MLVHATPTQADAIVRAMKCVATADGAPPLSAVDIAAIEACHHVMLHQSQPLDVSGLAALAPGEVAGLFAGDPHDAAADDRPKGFAPVA
jgi:hypothetical protein